MTFHDLVYMEIKVHVKDAIIALVDHGHEVKQIDWALLNNILGIFVHIGMGTIDAYEIDFETCILQDVVQYYSRKATSRIIVDSCPGYIKTNEWLMKEKGRLVH